MKLISVIIPYFNKEKTIERSINSVIEQTYTNWELIIVDDFSISRMQLNSKYSQFPITLIRNTENLGPGPSRQKGMEIAKGEYLAFLDADDWWDKRFLELSLSANELHNNAAGTWTISKVNHANKEQSLRRYSNFDFENIRETIVQYPRPWQTGSILWKKRYVGHWGDLSTNQDYFFEITSSLKNNRLKKVDEILYFIDQTQGNHRIDLVKHAVTTTNHFDLFEYFYREARMTVSRKLRFVLFHRISRCLLKVVEHNSLPTSTLYWRRYEQMYPFTRLLFRSYLPLKAIHRILQKTSFRLYF